LHEHGKSFIASKALLDKLGTHPKMKTQELGMVLLKGKTIKIALVSIEWRSVMTRSDELDAVKEVS